MRTSVIKQRRAEEEYIRCYKQTTKKHHWAGKYQKLCMFQTEGRREGSEHIARSGANDTIGPIAPKDSDCICATEVLCSGWGSTGTRVLKRCVQGGAVLEHV